MFFVPSRDGDLDVAPTPTPGENLAIATIVVTDVAPSACCSSDDVSPRPDWLKISRDDAYPWTERERERERENISLGTEASASY